MADPVSVFEVLVEDPGATASGGGLAEQEPVSLEGRSFRRFLAQNVRSGAKLVINVGAPTTPRGNRMLYVTVVSAAVIMLLALGFALTRRRSARVVVEAQAPDDAAHIARDIAELDDAFERVASPSDTERDAYHQRRDELKTRLATALAKQEVTV